MIRSLLRKKFPASRLAVSVGLGGYLFPLNLSIAQQVSNPTTSQAPETAAADRVVITGSNIPTSEEVGAAPVDTVDQAARDRTGQEDVESVITRTTPAISSGGGNLGQSNASVSSNATYGGSAIALHGLPTLVLLNGRRLTDSAAEAAGGSQFADVNLFPSALVKRIEVLKDGASAIYGTEAIGGVVNVILDQEFQGFAFSARYGFTEKSDVQNQRYSAIFGFGDDKTHIVVGAEYSEQDPVFNTDRGFANQILVSGSYAGVVSSGGVSYRLANGITDAQLLNPGVATLAPLTDGLYNRAGTNGTPAAISDTGIRNVVGLTLDQNRTNVFASADRQLFGKNVVAFADFLYAQNYSQSLLNGQPLNEGEGVVIPATAPYNPFGQDISAGVGPTVANRFISNPRVFRQDTFFYRIVAGLKGEIIPRYNYEVAFNNSEDNVVFKNFNLINGAQLNQAIAGGYDAAGNAVTGGAYSLVNGNLQPALNFFSRTPSAASLVGVFGTDNRDLETKFSGVDGKITAFPYDLPAGPIGFAAGGEYRHEFVKANIDPQNFIGATPNTDINVGRDVTAGFAEIQIPIIGPDMKIPGVYSLDVDGAVRFEDYDPGDSTWVPKAGFVYRPIKDIAVRGSFSKSFIAPNLYLTNGPTASGFSPIIDLNGNEIQTQEITGSNKQLDNTIADNYTVGIVLSPRQVPGLTLNADFFHVEEKRIVGIVDPTIAIPSVNNLGPASPFANLIHMNSPTGPGVTAPGQLQDPATASNYFLIDNEQNLGGARIGGVDFGAHYDHDFGKFGAASIGVDGTYYLQYKESTFAGSPFFNVIGFYTGLAAYVEQYHLTPQIAYTFQGFTASAIANYIPSGRDSYGQSLDPIYGVNGDKVGNRFPKIRDYYDIDLLFSYEFGLNKPVDNGPTPPPAPKDGKDGGKQVVSHEEAKKMMSFHLLDGLKVSFGIQNVTNAKPPNIVNNPDSSNTDASIYDPYQRQYYFVVTKKF